MEIALTGGTIIVEKGVFAREMLKKDSQLKLLLNYDKDNNLIKKPIISKNESDHTVTIDYNDASDIILDDSYKQIFEELKDKYKDKIKGRVTIRMGSMSTYFTMIDLNSNDEG